MISRENIFKISQIVKELKFLFIKRFCHYLEISEEQFWGVTERFRNKEIWEKDASGNWHIPGYITEIENHA